MSRYFAPIPGTKRHGDIVWRRHPGMHNIWLVYLDEYDRETRKETRHLLGQIHKLRNGYSAIANQGEIELNDLGSGFGTRWAATEFILKVAGSHPRRKFGER